MCTNLHCCWPDCEKPAEFRVIDAQEMYPDVAEIHACEAHVGALVGHCVGGNLDTTRLEEWILVPIPQCTCTDERMCTGCYLGKTCEVCGK
jgi:hypothetical protein